MNFIKFHEILMKNGKWTLPRATTRGGSPNHCNYKQIHRSRRGAIRPEVMKITKNTFSPFSAILHSELEKLMIFMNVEEIWLKGGPWAVPGTDHCFSLGISRFLSLQNPEIWPEIDIFLKFHEISCNFIKFHEMSNF